MTALPTSKGEVIAAIQKLAGSAPQSRHELSILERESLDLALHIQKRTALHDIPELVWHFVADADVRFKDPAYAEMQLAQLSEVLKDWERGPPPARG
jgi:hypothetical protein